MATIQPPIEVAVSERVFLYAAGAVLLVAFALAAMMGGLAWCTMLELRAARESLELSKQNTEICKAALIGSEARRDQMQRMVEFARGVKFPDKSAMGGP